MQTFSTMQYSMNSKIFFLYIFRLGDTLGSGQIGIVYKGVWISATRGNIEVAVKTLKEGSGEEDRVKFLQEAAIMGQFKHPNVVEMCGVVTLGEPVSLQICIWGVMQGHIDSPEGKRLHATLHMHVEMGKCWWLLKTDPSLSLKPTQTPLPKMHGPRPLYTNTPKNSRTQRSMQTAELPLPPTHMVV